MLGLESIMFRFKIAGFVDFDVEDRNEGRYSLVGSC